MVRAGAVPRRDRPAPATLEPWRPSGRHARCRLVTRRRAKHLDRAVYGPSAANRRAVARPAPARAGAPAGGNQRRYGPALRRFLRFGCPPRVRGSDDSGDSATRASTRASGLELLATRALQTPSVPTGAPTRGARPRALRLGGSASGSRLRRGLGLGSADSVEGSAWALQTSSRARPRALQTP